MIKSCLFCKTAISLSGRKDRIYCSKVCLKRDWYCSRHKTTYFKNPDSFFLTHTGIGFKWEKYVAKLLKARHLVFNGRNNKTERADLDWNGKLVDVKSAHLNFRKNKRGKPVAGEQKGYWSFKSTGKEKKIDFVVCVGVDNLEKPVRVFLFPADEYPKNGVTIGWNSKYDKYLYK